MTVIVDPWYEVVEGRSLEQGDLIEQCPILIPEYSSHINASLEMEKGDISQISAEIKTYDVVVMNQSCDLENGKLKFVLLCAYESLEHLKSQNSNLRPKKMLEKIRQGNIPNLHMLEGCELEGMAKGMQVIDFHLTFTMPIDFLTQFVSTQGKRLRLRSPYKEQLSHSFGHYFSRVGVPKSIAAFI